MFGVSDNGNKETMFNKRYERNGWHSKILKDTVFQKIMNWVQRLWI